MICTAIINVNKLAKFINPENKFTRLYNVTIERSLNSIQHKDIESCKQYLRMLIIGYAMLSIFSYQLYWKYLGTYNKETNMILAVIFLLGFMMTMKNEFITDKQKLLKYFRIGTFIAAYTLLLSYCFTNAIAEYFNLILQEEFMFKIAAIHGYLYATFLVILFIFLLISYTSFIATDLFIRGYKKLNDLFLRRSNPSDTAIAIIDVLAFWVMPILINLSIKLLS